MDIKSEVISEKTAEPEFTRVLLEDIYEMYSKRVYRFLLFRVGNASETEDLTADVFEKIIKNHKLYNRNKGKLETWIFTIARNTLKDYYKTKKNYMSLDMLQDFSLQGESLDNKIINEEEYKAVRKALLTLKEREITILSMKYAADMRNVEIAKVLHISEKNVGVILVRAKKKLKESYLRGSESYEKY